MTRHGALHFACPRRQAVHGFRSVACLRVRVTDFQRFSSHCARPTARGERERGRAADIPHRSPRCFAPQILYLSALPDRAPCRVDDGLPAPPRVLMCRPSIQQPRHTHLPPHLRGSPHPACRHGTSRSPPFMHNDVDLRWDAYCRRLLVVSCRRG